MVEMQNSLFKGFRMKQPVHKEIKILAKALIFLPYHSSSADYFENGRFGIPRCRF